MGPPDEETTKTTVRSSIGDIIELYKEGRRSHPPARGLKLTPTQRLQRLAELTRFAEQLRRAERKPKPLPISSGPWAASLPAV